MAAVALAVVGLLEGSEHERCIRLAAVPAPRGLPARPAGSPRRRARRPRGREMPGRSGGVGISRSCELRDQAFDPRRVGLARGRGRSPAPACARAAAATCSLVRIISRSISRWDSVCGDRAGADHVAARVEAELGLEGLDVEAGRPAALAEGRGRLAAPPRAARRPPPAAARGRRRSRRAGRSRAARRSGCGCGRSSPRAADPSPPSSISAVTASRSTPGARLQASSLSACGSIGSTAPGT